MEFEPIDSIAGLNQTHPTHNPNRRHSTIARHRQRHHRIAHK
jgi:hypothetical protein